jgi:hypothetical protein
VFRARVPGEEIAEAWLIFPSFVKETLERISPLERVRT